MGRGLTHSLSSAAKRRANQTALIFGQRRRTWAQFASRVARLASALRVLGVKTGDRVAMLANNSDRYIEYYYAVLWSGGIVLPLNSRLALAEILAQTNDAEPALLFVDDAHLVAAATIKAQAPSIRQVIFTGEGDTPAGMIGYEGAIATASACPDAGRSADDIAFLFYTGGTTGRAKGVVLTHASLLASASVSVRLSGMDESAVNLHVGPLFHLAAGARVLATTMVRECHVVLPRFRPRRRNGRDRARAHHWGNLGADDDRDAHPAARCRQPRFFKPSHDHLRCLSHAGSALARGVDEVRRRSLLAGLRDDRAVAARVVSRTR